MSAKYPKYPKHRKRNRALSTKQVAFRESLARGNNGSASAREAGYAPSTVQKFAGTMAQQARSEFAEELRKVGVTPQLRARKVLALLDAKQPKWNPSEEKWDEFENADVQLRTLQEVNRIEDEYPAPKDEGDNRPIQIIFPENFGNVAIGVGTNGQERSR